MLGQPFLPDEPQSNNRASFFKYIGGAAGAFTGAATPLVIAFVKSGTTLFGDTIDDIEFDTLDLPIAMALLGFIGGAIGYNFAISRSGREDPSIVAEFVNRSCPECRSIFG